MSAHIFPFDRPIAAEGHMPFPGHRTQQQVIEEAERYAQLPWCPPEYRPLYRKVRAKCGGAEARRILKDHIERRSPSALIGRATSCAQKNSR